MPVATNSRFYAIQLVEIISDSLDSVRHNRAAVITHAHVIRHRVQVDVFSTKLTAIVYFCVV